MILNSRPIFHAHLVLDKTPPPKFFVLWYNIFMPTVTIFCLKKDNSQLINLIKGLKIFLAEKLTCGAIKLSPKEISIRILNSEGNDMIGTVELEIKAHAFKERIEKQDEICNDVRHYIMQKDTSLGDVRVWLILSELGHSW